MLAATLAATASDGLDRRGSTRRRRGLRRRRRRRQDPPARNDRSPNSRSPHDPGSQDLDLAPARRAAAGATPEPAAQRSFDLDRVARLPRQRRPPDDRATPDGSVDPPAADSLPNGDVYDWYRRGLGLLESGNAAAAAQLLEHAAAAEPTSRSVREALARAQFDAGWYAAARDNFAWITEENPADDYAQFGLGLSAARTGDLRRAVEHLALAVAMRPDLGHYGTALRGARAALSRR